MKTKILILIMSVTAMITSAADLYVNGSGNANTYATIQAAVTAASSGDNIYVATVGTYSENVTVSNKSLFIIAAVADEEFTLSGTFTLSPGSGNEVTIIGLYNGNISASGYGTVNLISSFISSITSYSGNLKMNVYDCETTNSFVIANGSVKGCNILGGLDIYNNSGASADTIRIMGNHIEDGLVWSSNHAYFEICNNYIESIGSSSTSTLYAIRITTLQSTPGGTNLMANNTIVSIYNGTGYTYAYGIYFQGVTNGQNLVIANNYIDVENNYYNGYEQEAIYSSSSMSNALLANNFWSSSNGFSYGFTNSSSVDNGASQSSWSYNSNTGVISNAGVNMGLDHIEYRDINNTRNDIGTSGGPHAWSNYNTTTGKGAIFNLELPFQLYIGGNHNIKAKGFHKN